MLKFAAHKKDKKDKRGSKLLQSPSQESVSSFESTDEAQGNTTLGFLKIEASVDNGNFSDGVSSDTGTVKRRQSLKSDSNRASIQRYSNGAALLESSTPINCKAFLGGGKSYVIALVHCTAGKTNIEIFLKTALSI